ncbi:hypothetical protein ZIOFF_031936 [Zingiber officinale]|uniref:Deoxyuridine 5'-triphosphate nucleotidohydrolase n=1 Tax=Zingiber officinale TaxID=94328 RepID=A0A8J5GFI7_ZINOF|nr:hypothetical protein ZIOFF_031936 [Zingiber officinale]
MMLTTEYICIDRKKPCLLLTTTKRTEALFRKKVLINYDTAECNISTWEFFRYEYKYCIDSEKEQWCLLSFETIDGKATKQFWQQWRGYEAWQNSEANLLITRGLVGRLSNTPNVGFAYEIQGVVDYLTSHGVKALPGRSFSTSRLQAASHASIIEPHGRDLIHIGLRIEIPYGYYGRIASRSGLAWKSGIEVGAGVIDSDFRGEVQVLLFNRTNLPIFISSQQYIAQLIIEKIAMPEVYEVPHLSYTERGNKGFGSTDHHVFLPIDEASSSHEPRKLTTEDIFSLLLPQEKIAALVEEGLQNSFEKDHAATTSPGASVPHSMDTTLSYEEDTDSYLDYIQYLASLSNTEPKWNISSTSDTE